MSDDLQAKEQQLRQDAQAWFDLNQSHHALNRLAEATRIHVWLEMQKGIRPHMVECVRLHPKEKAKVSLTREDSPDPRVRHYDLRYSPPPDRRVAQAMEHIIHHKPQGKQMPAKVNW